eukprot:5342960-Heterocapsa_arctica.AAC.1
MIYRWKWDNKKTADDIAKYGHDGCARWYPGKHFCRKWKPAVEDDPGMRGFIEQHQTIFLDDTSAV